MIADRVAPASRQLSRKIGLAAPPPFSRATALDSRSGFRLLKSGWLKEVGAIGAAKAAVYLVNDPVALCRDHCR